MRRAVSARLERVVNLNTSLVARLSRMLMAAGIGSLVLLGLLFTLGERHLQAAPSASSLPALCISPAVPFTAMRHRWIDPTRPQQNKGTGSHLHAGPDAGNLSRSHLYFDLRAIPSRNTLNCARLTLDKKPGSDDQTSLFHRITNRGDQAEASRASRKTSSPGTAFAGDDSSIEVTGFGPDPGRLPQLTSPYLNEPGLSIKKTGNTDLVVGGNTITYTIVVHNQGSTNAVGIVISDSLPANTNFVANSISLDPADAGLTGSTPPFLATGLTITSGHQVTATFAVTVDPSASPGLIITNTAQLISADILTASTAIFTVTVTGSSDPILFVDKDGPITAMVGDIVTYTYTVLNLNIGDGSPIAKIKVIDSIAGAATYISGDFNRNDLLQVSEPWLYLTTYTIKASDPNPLINVVTAQGKDLKNNTVSATDTHQTTIIRSSSPALFIPIIIKNG